MSKVSMLERFQEEVVKQGRDTTLPSKLNDFWLDELQKNFEKLFESIGNDSGSDSNGCMSLAGSYYSYTFCQEWRLGHGGIDGGYVQVF